MGFNFNYSEKKEYETYGNLVHEEIELYGLKVKYFKTDRINIHDIFGEHSHIKVNNKDVFEISIKVEPEMFDMGGDIFNRFGVQSMASMNVYVSAKTMEFLHPELYNGKGYDGILNNLVKLPSGKFMEVTHFEDEVEGYNNLFTYADDKKIFKLTLRAYSQNADEVQGLDDEYEKIDLSTAFNIVAEEAIETNTAASATVQKVRKDESDGVTPPSTYTDTPTKKVNIKQNPFGDL